MNFQREGLENIPQSWIDQWKKFRDQNPDPNDEQLLEIYKIDDGVDIKEVEKLLLIPDFVDQLENSYDENEIEKVQDPLNDDHSEASFSHSSESEDSQLSQLSTRLNIDKNIQMKEKILRYLD